MEIKYLLTIIVKQFKFLKNFDWAKIKCFFFAKFLSS